MKPDEAGPLWLLFEDFMDSLPVRPWIAAAAILAIAIILATVIAARRKP